MLGKDSRRMLGLAVEERAVALAEVHSGGGARRVVRTARFELPPEATWDRPGDLGARLGAFIKEKGFAARRAVVGLPGRWVLARAKVLPPTPASAVAAVLRLAAEREYPGDAGEWALDYAGLPAADRKSAVLLAATPRERLARIVAVCTGAGLTVDRVTATMLALAAAGAGESASGDAATLHLAGGGAELAVLAEGTPVALERLSASAGPALEGELHRVLAAAALVAPVGVKSLQVHSDGRAEARADGRAGAGPDPTVDPGVWKEIGQKLGMEVEVNPPLTGFAGLTMSARAAAPPGVLAAIAVAGAGLGSKGTARAGVDFLHSRLAIAPPRRFTRPRVLAIAAALLLVGYILFLVADRFWQQHAIDELEAQLLSMQKEIADAKANIDRTNFARGWFDHRPRLLDCLRAITLAFPGTSGGGGYSGGVWATSLSLRDDLTGTLVGKATSERAAAELFDRLRASKRFADVRPTYIRQLDKSGRNVSFAVTFVYVGQE